MPVQAALVTWTGNAANNEWLDAANWSSDPNLPVEGTGTTGDELEINTTTNHPIFDAADGSRTYESIRVGYTGSSITGRLDVTGGTLVHDRNVQHRIGRGGNTGIVNVSGTGTLRAGHIAEIGIDNNSVGIVNVSDSGSWQLFRGATKDGQADVSISLGAGGTGSGTLNMSGGTVLTRFGVLLGQTSLVGSGLFHVMGGGLATIGGHTSATNNGFWLQRGNGTLQATVDSSGYSLGSIDIFDSGNNGSFVRFDAGSILDLGFSGAPQAGSWDLMTFRDGGLTNNGLTLAAGDADAGWSFAFVDTGGTSDPDTLRITSTIPEPASLAMLAIGSVIAALWGRRG
jgi:hypothetical protein